MQRLFDPVGVRYEVACDIIGAIISYHAAMIGDEFRNPHPSEERIQAEEAAQCALEDERNALRSDDPAAIEAVISKYGPIARSLFAKL